MGRTILLILTLAGGLVASAYLGIVDSQADADAARDGRDSLNTVAVRRAAPANDRGGGANPQYQQAYAQQKAYQTTRSLVPAAKPLAAPSANRRSVQPPAREQTFSQYLAVARRARGTLVFQPVGDLPLDQKRAVAHLLDAVSAFFGMPAVCASAIPLGQLPRNYVRVRDGIRQINADALMSNFLRPHVGGDIACIIALTEEEIYPGDRPSSGPVRGVSSYSGGTAVITTAEALDNSAADRGKNLARLSKISLHEMCHTFGLKHCSQYECLMNSCGDIREVDRIPLFLCPDCLAKVSVATGREPSLHLEDMLGLCKAKGFSVEARQYLRALQMLK